MNQNVEEGAKTDGQRTDAPRDRQDGRGLGEQMQGFLGKPTVGAAIAGAAVAAVIFNIPEALLGAAAGVTVYAIHKRFSGGTAKDVPPGRH
jgi:hypothetical protein